MSKKKEETWTAIRQSYSTDSVYRTEEMKGNAVKGGKDAPINPCVA